MMNLWEMQDATKILLMMIKQYEKRGGGYSQKEALRTAIRAFKCIKKLPSEKELEIMIAKWLQNVGLKPNVLAKLISKRQSK